MILASSHRGIRTLKKAAPAAVLHGNKVWTASYVLMDFLQHNPLRENLRILDLGCGWGVVSCFLARAFAANVTAVDADPGVQPFFELHAQYNAVAPQFVCERFERISADMLAQFDVITGADICFWDESAAPLARLIARAVKAGVKHIFIADPGRPPFWNLAEHCIDVHLAEVEMHHIDHPRKATKPVLVIHNA